MGERTYLMQSGSSRIASLTFRSFTGTFATAETAAESWTFKRIGFLNPKITIRRANREEDLAVYRPHVWGDGKIVFADGSIFIWKPINFWAIEWSLIDPAGEPLLRIKPGVADQSLPDLLKTQATIEIARASTQMEMLPLFSTFCMYLFVIHQMDVSAASAATAASM
jgi:hypothetical protein